MKQTFSSTYDLTTTEGGNQYAVVHGLAVCLQELTKVVFAHEETGFVDDGTQKKIPTDAPVKGMAVTGYLRRDGDKATVTVSASIETVDPYVERPWHRAAAYLWALGRDNRTIADALDVLPSTVRDYIASTEGTELRYKIQAELKAAKNLSVEVSTA